MFVALAMLVATITPVAPPSAAAPTVGPGRNGVAVAALPSSSPWAAAALALHLPDGVGDDDARAVLPVMAAAATAALGREVGPDRPGSGVEVAVTPGRLALVAVVPAGSADLAVRAVDAALKSLRAPPPKTPAPLPLTLGSRTPLPPGSGDVAAALKRLGTVDNGRVAIAVIGPGADLHKRSSALLTTPLAKAQTTTTTMTTMQPGPAGWRLADPTPPLVAAAFVLGALVGGTVERDRDGLRLTIATVADGGRAMLEGVATAPPPPEVVKDAAARQRLALALPLGDVPALARRLADDVLDDPGHDDAGASLAIIDAISAVAPTDVGRAAAALLAGAAP
jgi:hypothetical protein